MIIRRIRRTSSSLSINSSNDESCCFCSSQDNSTPCAATWYYWSRRNEVRIPQKNSRRNYFFPFRNRSCVPHGRDRLWCYSAFHAHKKINSTWLCYSYMDDYHEDFEIFAQRTPVTYVSTTMSVSGGTIVELADVIYFVFFLSSPSGLRCIQIIYPFRSSRWAHGNGVVKIGIWCCLL
jgi:hypothetical protein